MVGGRAAWGDGAGCQGRRVVPQSTALEPHWVGPSVPSPQPNLLADQPDSALHQHPSCWPPPSTSQH